MSLSERHNKNPRGKPSRCRSPSLREAEYLHEFASAQPAFCRSKLRGIEPEEIEKLTKLHQIEAFDCGVPELNPFLVNHALTNQKANSATTYVGCDDKK